MTSPWDLTTERTERGVFWQPETPERRIAGALAFAEDTGPQLLLDGPLTEDMQALLAGEEDYPAIHGIIGGIYVTLLGNIQTGFTFNLGGPAAVELRVGVALLGAHFTDEAPLFSAVQFDCCHLLDWLDPPGFDFQMKSGFPYQWNAAYQQPEPVDIYLDDGALVQVVTGGSVQPGGHTFNATVTSLVSVFPIRPKTVWQLVEDYVAPLRDLVSFATDSPVAFSTIALRSMDAVRKVGEHWRAENIDVLADFIQPRPGLREQKTLQPVFQLLSPLEVPGGIATLIPTWLDTYSRSREAIALYLGDMYQPNYWFPTRVAGMVQALEAYDRLNAEDQPDLKTQERVARILKATAEEDGAWLAPRLANAADPSLTARLRRVVERAAPVVAPMLDKQSKVVAALAEMRNAVAHPGDRKREVDMGGLPMLRAMRWAQWTLIANLLLDLGISPTDASKVLLEHQPFPRALRELQEWSRSPSS